MDDEVHDRIEQLAGEEHRLLGRHGSAGLSPAERARLQEIEVSLDQAWDLLRQRQARRDAGLDPEGAHERPAEVVEHYES